MEHILLANAFVYKKRVNVQIPLGFFFDKKQGVWKSIDGRILVEQKGFPGGASKKCDIETGEDQKGQ